MAKVVFSYGTKSEYTGLPVKDGNTLYFLTDSHEIYKGETLMADRTNLNVQFVNSMPEPTSSVANMLYVCTADGKTTLWIKNGESMVQVGGGEATEIADGIITIGKFATGLVAQDLSNPSDETLPTTKAVAEAIAAAKDDLADAIVDVVAEAAPEGTSGTVLKFTTRGGDEKSVNIGDIFLAAAEYDSATHDLKLTLNNQAQTVITVNLDDLIGNTLSDVVVGEDEAFVVELGTGGTLGGFKTGDSISKDMTIENIVKKLLMKQVPPTYTAPSVSITNNGGTVAGSYEIGTSMNVKLKATFTKNDAGDLTSIQFKKAGTAVGDAATTSPATYSEDAFALASSVVYTASATYSEGPVKKDNLGDDYPTGHISAGTKTSGNYTLTPYRQGYFAGYTADTTDLTSDVIRQIASSKKGGSYSSGTVTVKVPADNQRVFIACPATNTGVTKVNLVTSLNAEVTNTFKKTQVDIEGANGYSAITYNVWYFIPDTPYAQLNEYLFTLG